MCVRHLIGLVGLVGLAACGSTETPAKDQRCADSSAYVAGSCMVSDGRCFDYGPGGFTTAAQSNCAQVYRGVYRSATCASMGYDDTSETIGVVTGDGLCLRLRTRRATDAGASRD
jgi:hypothetical protein